MRTGSDETFSPLKTVSNKAVPLPAAINDSKEEGGVVPDDINIDLDEEK
jgi:hypothetical protein